MTSTISEMALFFGRWTELSILGKATIVLLVGLGAARLAHRGRASVRHLFLVATFGMLLALPLVSLALGGLTIDVPVAGSFGPSTAASAIAAAAPLPTIPATGVARTEQDTGRWSLPSWPMALRMVWLTGVVLLWVSLGISLWRLRRMRRQGVPSLELRALTRSLATAGGIRRNVDIFLHEDIPAPLTFGVLRPAIFLPTSARNWTDAQLRRALVHELEHVQRHDWITQVFARATCAFYWFHPLTWMAWRQLSLEAERTCDDAVVKNAERADYAEQLVLLAQQMSKGHAQLALGMANRSDLSRRISALLDGSQRRGRVGLMTAGVAMMVASVLLLAIAPMRVVSRAAVQVISPELRANTTGGVEDASELDQALFEAAAKGDLAGIERLITAGANVNCAIDGDGSPLIGAALNGHIAAVRLLLERGADVNLAVPGDGNPLIMAAREGHVDVVALLLDKGAVVDQVVPSDENALIQASGNGHLAVVKLLVGRGADVNAQVLVDEGRDSKPEVRSPLSMARKGGHTAVVNFLIASGAR